VIAENQPALGTGMTADIAVVPILGVAKLIAEGPSGVPGLLRVERTRAKRKFCRHATSAKASAGLFRSSHEPTAEHLRASIEGLGHGRAALDAKLPGFVLQGGSELRTQKLAVGRHWFSVGGA